MSRNSIAIMLLLVVLIGLSWWGYSKLEWVEKTVDSGFKSDARKNPYLAAKKFLGQKDIHVSESMQWSSLDFLDSQYKAYEKIKSKNKLEDLSADVKNKEKKNIGTLIVISSRLMLGKHRQKQMWEWVQKGGHLITHAQAFTDTETDLSKDELLNKLSLHLYQGEMGETTRSINAETTIRKSKITQAHRPWLHHAYKFDEKSCPEKEYLVELDFEGIDKPVKSAFTPGLFLEDFSENAVSWSINDDGIQMIQYEIGQGLITVMTDTSLWSNGKIACFDHAYLLWLLTRKNGGVHFLYNAESPSLWQLMWKRAPFVILFGGVLLLLWIWNRSSRFGPFIVTDHQKRRELREHLNASAMFLWSQKKYKKLYEPLQKIIISTLVMRHHHVAKLSGNERSNFVSQLTHIDPNDVHWALNCKICENRNTFVRLMRILQLIRNKL